MAAFTLMAASGLVWNSFGLFLVAIETEQGWSRAAVSAAFGAFALANAVSAPMLGYAMGQRDSRHLLAGLAVLLGLALAGSALTSCIEAFWLIFGIVGGAGSHCFSSYAIFTVLARRFRDRPAIAMAIADAGSGLGAFLGLPLIHWTLTEVGWRCGYMILGVVVAVLGVWLHLKLLDPIRRLPTGPEDPSRAGFGRVILNTTLLALALSYFCGSAAYQGLLTQQIALFAENGIASGDAVWLTAWAGLVVFAWRLASGWLSDVWSLAGVMALAALAAVATFAALAMVVAQGPAAALLIYPLTMGLAFGGTQVLLATGAHRIAMPQDFPVVLGFCRLASGIGMASGPVAAGFIHDVTHTYTGAIGLLIGLTTIHFAAFGIAIRSSGARQGGKR